MREADNVGTLVHAKPDDHRIQIGKRRQAGMSAALPQEFGQYNLLPGCARLMLLHERAHAGHPKSASLSRLWTRGYLVGQQVAERG